jgi:hypothetical protein
MKKEATYYKVKRDDIKLQLANLEPEIAERVKKAIEKRELSYKSALSEKD